MADSYVLIVEKALTAHIESVVTSNAVFDLTGKVHRGRDRFGHSNSDNPPIVSLLQAADIDDKFSPVGDSGSTRHDGKLYLLQGWVTRGNIKFVTDPVHPLLAEVKRALAMINDMNSPHYGLKDQSPSGNYLVESVKISSGLVRPPEQESSPKHAYFWLPISVGMLENVNDPYELP